MQNIQAKKWLINSRGIMSYELWIMKHRTWAVRSREEKEKEKEEEEEEEEEGEKGKIQN